MVTKGTRFSPRAALPKPKRFLAPASEIDPDPDAPLRRDVPGTDYHPTNQQRLIVAALSACGIRNAGIAAFLHIHEHTLMKHFRVELSEAYDRVEAALTGTLMKKALEGNITALLFTLRAKFGWRETNRDTDGKLTIDSLSDEGKVQLIAALRASINAGAPGTEPGGEEQAPVVASAGTPNGSHSK